jgi:hypothetical protein
MTDKYAICAPDGKYIREWDPQPGRDRLTPDINKAKLYTRQGLRENLTIFARRKYTLVPVRVAVMITAQPVSPDSLLQEELALLRAEFDVLDAVDVDTLSEGDYQRWRRLSRVLGHSDLSLLTD